VAAAEGTDIPLVFIAVTDPVRAGLVDSWDEPGGNVTRVSDMAKVEPQIRLIKDIIPDIKFLGVVYKPDEVNSQVQI
jgi:putative ABC transport system substrate-binding protein